MSGWPMVTRLCCGAPEPIQPPHETQTSPICSVKPWGLSAPWHTASLPPVKKLHDGTSSAPPLQGVQVWSLVRELSSCLLPGTAKKQNNNNKNLPKDQSPVHPSCRYKSSRYKSVLCKHGTKNSSGLLGTVSLNRKHFCVCVCVCGFSLLVSCRFISTPPQKFPFSN